MVTSQHVFGVCPKSLFSDKRRSLRFDIELDTALATTRSLTMTIAKLLALLFNSVLAGEREREWSLSHLA